MTETDVDLLSFVVILVDLCAAIFLIWRATAKRATLWGAARIVYLWIALMTLYHAVVYVATLIHGNENYYIATYLHPCVFLFILNPLLIAIIHWRGGRL